MKVACIHPTDLLTVWGKNPYSYAIKNNALPSKFGAEGIGYFIIKLIIH